MATRKELIAAVGQRYRDASKNERSKILDEFAELTQYHRKHAIRVLTRVRCEPHLSLARNRLYDEAVRQALIVLWEAGDRLCGKRLKALPNVAETTKAKLREQFTALDPVRLLQEIRAAQNTLADIAQTGTHEHAPPAPVTDVAMFLSTLSKAWKDGEVRPTHRKQPGAIHWWRSRADPFEHAWPVVEQWLETESTVTASEMMDRLSVMVPDAYASKAQLRTLQRRVKQWRAEKVKDLILGKLRQSAGNGEGAAEAAPSPLNQKQKATQ